VCFYVGPCLQGYFCQGGATKPTPDSSDGFPRNGPCPVGHFCPRGCFAPVLCPLGSIRNTTGTLARTDHKIAFFLLETQLLSYIGNINIYVLCVITLYPECCLSSVGGVSMESCFACPAGHYCSAEGLASASGPCAAGFYCPYDFSSTTPYAFLCPKVSLFMYTFNLLVSVFLFYLTEA